VGSVAVTGTAYDVPQYGAIVVAEELVEVSRFRRGHWFHTAFVPARREPLQAA
jgi:hypothetical protein